MKGKLYISRAALARKDPEQNKIYNNMQNIEELKQQIIKSSASEQLSAKQSLEFDLLNDALKMYQEASENIEQNGITMSFNAGKTFGLNPCLKVKNDSVKIIMRILKSLFAKIDNEDEDDEGFDFIESLTKPSKLPIYQ